MLHVRDAVREVFRSQLADKVDDAAIVKARTNLNWTYDSFVARFGPLSARENVRRSPTTPTSRSSCPLKSSTRRLGKPRRLPSSCAKLWNDTGQSRRSRPRRRLSWFL